MLLSRLLLGILLSIASTASVAYYDCKEHLSTLNQVCFSCVPYQDSSRFDSNNIT